MPQQLRFFSRIYDFVGSRSCIFIAITGFLGVGAFCLEFLFAYCIQAFLLAVGVSTNNQVQLPHWFPTASLGWILGLFSLTTLVRACVLGINSYLMSVLGEEFKARQRRSIVERAFHSPSSSVHGLSAAFSELTFNSAGCIVQFAMALNSSILVLCFFAGLSYFSWRLALCALLLVPMLAWPVRALNRRVRTEGEGCAQEWESLNKRFMLGLRNLLFLRLHGLESQEQRLAEQSVNGYLTIFKNGQVYSSLVLCYPQVVGGLAIAVLTFAAKSSGWLTGGLLVVFFYLLFRLLQTLSTMSYSYSVFLYALPNCRKLFHLYESPRPEIRRLRSPAELMKFEGAIGWIIEDLWFRYDEKSDWLFRGANLVLPPGEITVLQGGSGVGKTTFLSLLLGELQPSQGRVEIVANGSRFPLEKVRDSVLARIGYVGPDPFLVEGTLEENLFFGVHKPPPSLELNKALSLAGAEFVHSIPEQLRHKIGGQGQGLSAGQKQRVALTRALLRKPAALFLDEATSNLDARTEEKVISTILNLRSQVTQLVITHRDSLLQLNPRYYVLREGQFVTQIAGPCAQSNDHGSLDKETTGETRHSNPR